MKKIFLIIINLILLVTLFAYQQNNNVFILKNYSTHYIFENKVNIRTAPNLNSDIIIQVQIGDLVKIIERSEIRQELYGLMAYWYKIKYTDKIGYLWGGFISTIEIKADFDNNGKDEILISRCTTNGEYNYDEYMVKKYYHDYKLCRKGELLSDNPFINEPIGLNSSFYLLKNLDFNPVIVLLNISQDFNDGENNSFKNEIYYLKNNIFCLLYKYEENVTPNEENIFEIKYPKDSKINNVMVIIKRKIKYDMKTFEVLSNNVLDRIELIWNGIDFNRLNK